MPMVSDYIKSLSVSILLPSYEEISPESLPASDTMSSLKSDMSASEPFISEETVEHTSDCELLLDIYHLPSFLKSLSSIKKIKLQRSPPFTH